MNRFHIVMPFCFLLVLSAASGSRAETVDEVAALKAELERNPHDASLKRRLGIAYYRAGNDFWAIRILAGVVDANPVDCNARAWLGLAYIRRAFPEQALASVNFDGCTGPAAFRLRMVESIARKASGDAETADSLLSDAAELGEGWTEDVDALPAVTRRVNPDNVPEAAWSIEIGAGYSSNAVMGAATDEAASAGAGSSALSIIDARVRLVPDFGGPVRGLLEIQPKLHWYFADGPDRLSFLELTGQAGIMIRRTLPRVTLAYRPDWLLLPNGFRGETEPVPYMMGHRGEFEVELRPEVLIFGGAGTRSFRDMVRSRTEVDLGLGGSASPVRNLSLLWAASARYYDARHDAWDLAGFSAMVAAVMRLPFDMSARASMTLSMDWYYDSAAENGVDPFRSDFDRFDYFFRTGFQFWSPSLAGVRFGVSYDFSSRQSTAELYSYSDHRVLVRVRWTGSAAFRRPSQVAMPDDAGVVEWGGGEGSGIDERVQDMLRQDEQVQRSSSCIN